MHDVCRGHDDLRQALQSDVEFSFSDIGIWSCLAATIVAFLTAGEPNAPILSALILQISPSGFMEDHPCMSCRVCHYFS